MRALVMLTAAVAIAAALKANPAAWMKRTIYQIVTDRFAVDDGSSPSCDKHDYCGGTWTGIKNKLDYIQGMGFDAIWISPVLANSEGGYHGYWPNNWYATNTRFGSSEALQGLIDAAHERGMYVMIDVVTNNVGHGDIVPFGRDEYFHDCNGCPESCQIEDFKNQTQVEHCRLRGLRDLDHENSFVVKDIIASGEYVVTFSPDGLRLDAVPEVPTWFWDDYRAHFGTFSMGEVRDERIEYSASYQQHMDSVLAYPMYYALRSVFAEGGSFNLISDAVRATQRNYRDMNIIGNFVDNHDNPRFLNVNGDVRMYKNALAYTVLADGIPIVYYGTEQEFSGGAEPENREPLWQSGYKTNTDMYKFLATTVKARKQLNVWKWPQEELASDTHFYAFSRGQTAVVALTNVVTDIERTFNTPYKKGAKVCNIYAADDCLTVGSSGQIAIKLHGEPKVYALA